VDSWQPPPDLLDFLNGEVPIYAGFGSPSAVLRRKALTKLSNALAAAAWCSCQAGAALIARCCRRTFFIARDVPHEWLFPRVSLAIHNGGAGTAHAAARAGVPQVILPFGVNQFFWASRVAARGAAPRFSGWGAAAIAKMIAFAPLDSTRRNAQELGQAMAREDGVGTAVSSRQLWIADAEM